MAEIQRSDQTQTQTAEIMPPATFQERGAVGVVVSGHPFGAYSRSMLIQNTHGTNDLYVFLLDADGKWNTYYTTISAGGSMAIDTRHNQVRLQGSGGSTNYEILATLE